MLASRELTAGLQDGAEPVFRPARPYTRFLAGGLPVASLSETFAPDDPRRSLRQDDAVAFLVPPSGWVTVSNEAMQGTRAIQKHGRNESSARDGV